MLHILFDLKIKDAVFSDKIILYGASSEEIYNFYYDMNLRKKQIVTNKKLLIEDDEKSIMNFCPLEDNEEIIITFADDFNVDLSLRLISKMKHDIVIEGNNLSLIDLKKIASIKPNINIKISSKYNMYEMVSLEDYIKTKAKVIEIREKIKLLNTDSELEKLMIIFDQLKQRKYKKTEEANLSISRDLTKVLFSDEIVCAGYANVFCAIANNLNIPSYVRLYFNKEKNEGHATCVCFVNDKVHKYKGVLEFDLTLDCIKHNETGCNVNRYLGYGLTYNQMTKFNNNRGLECVYIEPLNFFYNSYNRYNAVKKLNAPNIIIRDVQTTLLKRAKNFYELLKDESGIQIIHQHEQLLGYQEILDDNIIEGIKTQIENTLDKKSCLSFFRFAEVFYSVRRIQHFVNPHKYPLSNKIIDEAILQKYSVDILNLYHILCTPNNLIKELNLDTNIPSKVKKKMDLDIKRIELLHTLNQIKNEKVKKLSKTY